MRKIKKQIFIDSQTQEAINKRIEELKEINVEMTVSKVIQQMLKEAIKNDSH